MCKYLSFMCIVQEVCGLSGKRRRLIPARDGKELPEVLREMETAIDRDYLYGLKEAAVLTGAKAR